MVGGSGRWPERWRRRFGGASAGVGWRADAGAGGGAGFGACMFAGGERGRGRMPA